MRRLALGLSLTAHAANAELPSEGQIVLLPVQAGGLTSEEAGRRAGLTSYDAQARADALRAANARLEQALADYLPQLSLTARYQRLSPVTNPTFTIPGPAGVSSAPVSFPVPLNFALLQAAIDVPLSDYILRISQNYAAAARNKRAAFLDEQAARLLAAQNGRQYYYSWLRAVAQVAVEERALTVQRAHLADARTQFEVGAASRADVLTVESQVASQELQVVRARNLADVSEEQLRLSMDDLSGRHYAIGEDIEAPLPPLAGMDNLKVLQAEALDRRLELRSLDETSRAYREQAKFNRAGYFPKIDLIGDLIYANPNQRIFPQSQVFTGSWDVGAQFTWNPNDIVQSGALVSQSLALSAQALSQREGLSHSVLLEVQQAYQALRENEVAVQTTSQSLAAAREGYRVRRELFRNGRATSVELTDSEVQLTRAELDWVAALANLRAARASVVHAAGRDVPPSLLQGP